MPRLLQLVKGNRIILPEHISSKISLIHLDNLIDAVQVCFKENGKMLSIYNISDDVTYSLKATLPELIRCAYNKKLHLLFIPKKIKSSNVQVYRTFEAFF